MKAQIEIEMYEKVHIIFLEEEPIKAWNALCDQLRGGDEFKVRSDGGSWEGWHVKASVVELIDKAVKLAALASAAGMEMGLATTLFDKAKIIFPVGPIECGRL